MVRRLREAWICAKFLNKAAVVTGGASGIGLALARAFSETGCKVMLADIEKTALDEALASLRGMPSEIRGVVCDVADPASVDRAAAAAFAAFGKVHIVCNNAGGGAHGGIDHIVLELALGAGRQSDGRRQRGARLSAAYASSLGQALARPRC